MILSDIKRLLGERGQASLAELSQHFGSDPEAMRGMLEFWIARGRVLRHVPSCGSGCTQCAPEVIEVYTWEDNPPATPKVIPIKPVACPQDQSGKFKAEPGAQAGSKLSR